jgi:hypothetical protein
MTKLTVSCPISPEEKEWADRYIAYIKTIQRLKPNLNHTPYDIYITLNYAKE